MKQSFRTAMFGFNKEDVAKFIYQQDKVFENKLAEKDSALKEAKSIQEETERRAREWEKSRQTVSELEALLTKLKEKSDALAEALDGERTDMDAIEAGYTGLEDRCQKLEAFREKAKKFDSLATALSGIFGNGIQNEESDGNAVPEEASGVSPIHQARVNQENRIKIVQELQAICEEIVSLSKEF